MKNEKKKNEKGERIMQRLYTDYIEQYNKVCWTDEKCVNLFITVWKLLIREIAMLDLHDCDPNIPNRTLAFNYGICYLVYGRVKILSEL